MNDNLLNENDKKKIIDALNSKGVKTTCPMCGNKQFAIADGYFTQNIQKNFNQGIIIGGPAIPTIGIICSNCGFISQHAIGFLGLLKVELKNKTEDGK